MTSLLLHRGDCITFRDSSIRGFGKVCYNWDEHRARDGRDADPHISTHVTSISQSVATHKSYHHHQ